MDLLFIIQKAHRFLSMIFIHSPSIKNLNTKTHLQLDTHKVFFCKMFTPQTRPYFTHLQSLQQFSAQRNKTDKKTTIKSIRKFCFRQRLKT